MDQAQKNEQRQLYGELSLPVIDADARNSDPWKRNYQQPPQFKRLIPRSFPLVDLRPQLSDANYLPEDMLKGYGFGVVKHQSEALFAYRLQQNGDGSGFPIDRDRLQLYYGEMQELVKKTTGARHVFITHSVVRGGKMAEKYEMPKGFDARQDIIKEDWNTTIHVPTGKPVRIPHQDYTPLGARQSIRHMRDDIYKAAFETGVITAENQICEKHPFSAKDRESDPLIAMEYNNQKDGKIGPRYAAYSIWRPLETVKRDPLALCPRTEKKANAADVQYTYFHYDNKVPGPAHLGGDFLKEFAALGLKETAIGDSKDVEKDSNNLKWYYVSAQEPDEVLFIKLFDSAALGEDAKHAGAPWHASPALGDVEGGPRESVELRVLSFW